MLPSQAAGAGGAAGAASAASAAGAGGMEFSTMMEGLVMVSGHKYKGMLVPSAMERLMEDCVKSFGADDDGQPFEEFDDELRQQLHRSAEMRMCVQRLNHQLRELYRFWSSSDARDERTDLLSCKELISMLLKASAIGKQLSVVHVKAYMMLALYSSQTPAFAAEHEAEHLTFGDFVEVLARCAREYFKASKVATTLEDQMLLLVEHAAQTTYRAGHEIGDLREPKQEELSDLKEASAKAHKERERQAAKTAAIAERRSPTTVLQTASAAPSSAPGMAAAAGAVEEESGSASNAPPKTVSLAVNPMA